MNDYEKTTIRGLAKVVKEIEALQGEVNVVREDSDHHYKELRTELKTIKDTLAVILKHLDDDAEVSKDSNSVLHMARGVVLRANTNGLDIFPSGEDRQKSGKR